MSKIRALFVDDQESFLELARIYMSKYPDLIFTSALSAKIAFEILKTEPIDIVVSDDQMTGMSGLEFLEEFRKQYDLPFIILTGKSREELAVKALNLGANHYMQKGGDTKAQFEILMEIIIQQVKHYKNKKEYLRTIKENEERLVTIFDSMDEAIYISDIETYELLYCNKALIKKAGKINPSQKCYEYLQNRHAPCPFCTNDKIVGEYQGKSYIWEFRNKKNNRWYKCIDRAISWPDRDVVRCEITFDITKRKKAEENYKAFKETYLDIFNTLTEAIYIQDEEGTFLDINKGAEKLYGLTRETLIGRKPEMLSAPGMNNLEQVMEHIKNTFTTGKPSRFEFWAKRKDGSIFPKDIIVNKGKYFGRDVIIATGRDISELKEAEKALQKSEERLRILTNNLPNGYVYQVSFKIDEWSSKRFTYISKGVEDIHGISAEEVLKDPFILNSQLSEQDIQMITERETSLFRKRETFSAKVEFNVASGEKKWLLLTSSPRIEKNDELVCDGIAIDITERKKAQLLVKRQNEELQTLTQYMEHELNNSIFSLSGYLELLETEKDKDERKKWGNKIKKQITYITKTMKKSRELAKAGDIIGKKQVIDLNELITSAKELVVPDEIMVKIINSLPDVKGDFEKLLIVFKNIFENAVIHGNPTFIEINSTTRDSDLIISIENDGTIITDKKIQEINNGSLDRLGYKIMMKILDAHGWGYKISNKNQRTKIEIIINII